jgi:hypothetical protein
VQIGALGYSRSSLVPPCGEATELQQQPQQLIRPVQGVPEAGSRGGNLAQRSAGRAFSRPWVDARAGRIVSDLPWRADSHELEHLGARESKLHPGQSINLALTDQNFLVHATVASLTAQHPAGC